MEIIATVTVEAVAAPLGSLAMTGKFIAGPDRIELTTIYNGERSDVRDYYLKRIGPNNTGNVAVGAGLPETFVDDGTQHGLGAPVYGESYQYELHAFNGTTPNQYW